MNENIETIHTVIIINTNTRPRNSFHTNANVDFLNIYQMTDFDSNYPNLTDEGCSNMIT